MRRLLFVTGTRADFGIWLPVLRAAARHAELEPSLLVSAMHLDPRFGATVSGVRASGLRIAAEIACTPTGDSAADMAGAVGLAVSAMAPAIERERPDWLLLLGDRGEQLAAAIVGVHLEVPIGHLAGGDRTRGAIDDAMRDMISRAASTHFATSVESAARLRRMGEEDWRVLVTGSPALDDLAELASADAAPVRRLLGLPEDGPYLLVLQHPQTRGGRDAAADMDATLRATAASGLPRVAILPNADAGSRAMIARLEAEPGIRSVPSLPRPEFAVLLANAAALVGNSSAGLTEASLLRVPAVNVGTRQAGRLRGDNVVDAPPDADAILRAIQRVLQPAFRAGLTAASPHGSGGAAEAIVRALATVPIDARLLHKVGEYHRADA
jgi:GDP/UDP-N,N'-diacetylbacillosamine 2-epimerase (hydrolysing)